MQQWVINEEASIVRRIFDEYLARERTPAIVKRLNAEGVKPPRGRYWQPGALTGSNNRHNGVLENEIYCGRLVWNRVRMIKDPDTGKRVSPPNPESDWERADAPHLAIVSPEAFEQAAVIRRSRRNSAPSLRRRPKSILSELLRCGVCGGGMSIKGNDRGGTRLICSAFKNAGACSNHRTFYKHHIEQVVLAGLRSHLVDPRAIRHFLKTYHEERKRLAMNTDAVRPGLESRLGEVLQKAQRLTDAMLDSDEPVSAFTARIAELERGRAEIEKQLASLAEPVQVVALHPAAQDHYLAVVNDLAKAINSRAPGSEMAEALRELVESVVVHKTEPGEPIRVKVNGRLAALTGTPMFPESSLSGVKLVAGERYLRCPDRFPPSFSCPWRNRRLGLLPPTSPLEGELMLKINQQYQRISLLLSLDCFKSQPGAPPSGSASQRHRGEC